jgi:kynurenine formamidase
VGSGQRPADRRNRHPRRQPSAGAPWRRRLDHLEGHKAGEVGYCQLEKLHNLEQLPPPSDFTVACFPVNVSRASAGWTRAVAILPD